MVGRLYFSGAGRGVDLAGDPEIRKAGVKNFSADYTDFRRWIEIKICGIGTVCEK